MSSTMGANQVDPAYVSSLVESYMPCSRSLMQSGTLHVRSEAYGVGHCPPMNPVFTRIGGCPTVPSVIPVNAFRVDDETFSITCSDGEYADSLANTTMYGCHRPKPARDIYTLLVSINAQTDANHGRVEEPTYWREGDMDDIMPIPRRRCGLSGNCFPASVTQPTSHRHTLPQSAPEEVLIPAPIDKGIPSLSALFPVHQIPHISLETQGESYLEVSREGSLPSPKPIERSATASFSRNTIASKKQAKQHTRVRHRCEVCHKGFAQKQGVTRHRLEKHEPNYCPHCPTFSWARLYRFKQHLKKKHPEVDIETAPLNVGRSRQSGPIDTADRTNPRSPLSRPTVTSGHHSRGDTRTTARSSFAKPLPSESLDPFYETLDIGSRCEDTRGGTQSGALCPF